METKDVLIFIREKHSLTQAEMAEKLFITRQAVSRWETGETIPNTEALKLISKTFDVSINTLLGSPRQLICQCCGMPLDDTTMSREKDNTLNENYCKWCYAEGNFVYNDLSVLINFLLEHNNLNCSKKEAELFYEEQLRKLDYWKNN